MVQINLLPWRELKRQQEKRVFIRRLGLGSAFALLTIGSINYHVLNLINNQQIRNQKLQQELTLYERTIKEAKILQKTEIRLLSQISTMHNLLARRTLLVHLFDELTWVVPSGIYLSKVESKGNVIFLSGYAQSNADVSWILQNMEHSEWIKQPILHMVKQVEDKQNTLINYFKLTFILGPKHPIGTPS
ncbi:PilN domain-containing protein [Legionella saoudiensis]|uniref:PilN domain-containing protein n=1 Tax=Legionella saoudiensis TaxID=1750561 RepID=UPI0007303106|nr:PilN domain-containing protein [Legionella saoudiensis]